MWNLLFYVKADQPGKEYNYCVKTTLQAVFDAKRLLEPHNVVVQAKRRCAPYEVPTASDDEGLTWEPSGKVYFDGPPRDFTARDYADLDDVTARAPHAPEAEMASVEALILFVEQALKSTAKDTPSCLVFWSHAGGWADPLWNLLDAFGLARTPKGQPTNVSKAFMSLPGLCLGIRAGLARAGRQSLDIVAFNSCLMGCVEAAYELRKEARFLVASEASIPYTQWDQRPWLEDLGKNPTMPPGELVASLLSSFDARHGEGVCISALDLSQVEGLVTEMAAFVRMSERFSSATWNEFRDARDAVTTLGWHNSKYDVLTVDIVDLFSRAAKRCKDREVADQARRITAACRQVVIDARASPDLHDRNGISVFFPPTRSDFTRLGWGARYVPGGKETAEFVGASGWSTFLEKYWKAARRP